MQKARKLNDISGIAKATIMFQLMMRRYLKMKGWRILKTLPNYSEYEVDNNVPILCMKIIYIKGHMPVNDKKCW